jgi:hypothetical protein
VISECSEPDQDSLLAQTVLNASGNRIRDALTRFGIPTKESVLLKIESADGKIVANCQIPPSSNEFPRAPLTNLREEILEIMNKGEEEIISRGEFPGTPTPETLTSLLTFTLEIGTVKVNIGETPVKFSSSQIRLYAVKICPWPPGASSYRCCYM